MIEKAPNQPLSKRLFKWFRNIATALAISLTLTNCASPEEKYERQVQKVQELEYKLMQQQKNYHDVATQWAIQEDLKKNWADQTINQEIWYSIERTHDQDQEIFDTKEDLAEAQRELATMKEEMDFRNRAISEYSEKPNPHKYDYIPEEFKRSKEAK